VPESASLIFPNTLIFVLPLPMPPLPFAFFHSFILLLSHFLFPISLCHSSFSTLPRHLQLQITLPFAYFLSYFSLPSMCFSRSPAILSILLRFSFSSESALHVKVQSTSIWSSFMGLSLCAAQLFPFLQPLEQLCDEWREAGEMRRGSDGTAL
jgi:hypothetical protein